MNILWYHTRLRIHLVTKAARHLICLDPDVHDRAQWPVFFNTMPGIETKHIVNLVEIKDQ